MGRGFSLHLMVTAPTLYIYFFSGSSGSNPFSKVVLQPKLIPVSCLKTNLDELDPLRTCLNNLQTKCVMLTV